MSSWLPRRATRFISAAIAAVVLLGVAPSAAAQTTGAPRATIEFEGGGPCVPPDYLAERLRAAATLGTVAPRSPTGSIGDLDFLQREPQP